MPPARCRASTRSPPSRRMVPSRFCTPPTRTAGLAARQVSVLIAFYLSLPWITVNGYPAVFLDLAVGVSSVRSDVCRAGPVAVVLCHHGPWILAVLHHGLLGACGVAGRARAVFLDFVYRRIERWIEGDAVQRRVLERPALGCENLQTHAQAQALSLVSTIITHLFLAYFVSLAEVWDMMRHAPTEHKARLVSSPLPRASCTSTSLVSRADVQRALPLRAHQSVRSTIIHW